MMDFLKELLKREPLAYLAIGGIFLATAATGGWPTFHVLVDEPTWRYVLAVFGGALIVVSVWLARREPEPVIDCAAYEISMLSPGVNQTLTPPIIISGRCKALPKGVELWVFSISGSGAAARYWPQDSSDVVDETWSVRAHPGQWKAGDHRKYGVFLVGPNGQALLQYFRAVSSTGRPGIIRLTNDIVQCGPAREITLA